MINTVSQQRNEYTNYSKIWQKMRDCINGQESIHKGGEKYLPRLDKQTQAQYQAYKGRALFLAATSRTVDSMVGQVFRKHPEIEIPPAMEQWADDITASGVSIEQLCKECMTEFMAVTRYGLLVDWPKEDTTGRTVAQVEAEGLRPRIKKYLAENIINWKTDTIGNREVLTMAVLLEMVDKPQNEFDTNTQEKQYRVLDLDENGYYRQRIFDEAEVLIEELWPQMNGGYMDFIPFYIWGEEGDKAKVCMPVLNDLADINLSHYQAYADYRHGMHYTALPTPWMVGVSESEAGENGVIGPNAYWASANSDAKFGFLEFEGKGLDSYVNEIDRLETQMGNFGAKLLKEPKRAAEAAETAAINRAGESSMLASWAGAVAESVRVALEVARDWAGITGDVSVSLNTDYMPIKMDPAMLRELTAAVTAGRISYDTYYMNLVRGEIASEDRSWEEEQGLIELDGPMVDEESPTS